MDMAHPPNQTDWLFTRITKLDYTEDCLVAHGSRVASTAIGANYGVEKRPLLVIISRKENSAYRDMRSMNMVLSYVANHKELKANVVFAAGKSYSSFLPGTFGSDFRIILL